MGGVDENIGRTEPVSACFGRSPDFGCSLPDPCICLLMIFVTIGGEAKLSLLRMSLVGF